MSELDPKIIDAVGRAISDAAFGYEMKLSRLVDGVSTYALKLETGEQFEFGSTDEAYEKIASEKAKRQAEAAITAYLSAVSPLSDGDGWQPIETAPSSKIDVLFYRRDAVWHDSRTNAPAVVPDGVRYDFGYWDEEFFYHGTNHAVFEFGAKPGDFGDNPTHWRPLPAGPRDEVAHD